jgi:dolichyl-phosphate-mannose-protein mannosyltransferase
MDTEAASTSPIKIDFTIPASPIALILAVGLLVRLIAAALPGFAVDLGTFESWSVQLAQHGPWDFYTPEPFPDWAPGYLYVLWFIGGLDSVFDFSGDQFWYVLKIPSIAADLASAYLLYRILEGQKDGVRLGAAALYLLHPVVLLVGPVWGQVDSILAFFLLLTVYYLARERTLMAGVVFTVGFLVKPQAVAALPVFVFWGLRDEIRRVLPTLPDAADGLSRAIAFGRGLAARVWPVAVASLAAAFLMVIPFFPSNPLGIFDQLKDATELYPYNSFYAYNFWSLDLLGLTQWLTKDNLTFLGLAYRSWGIILFAVASLSIIWTFRDARGPGLLALATALSVLAFYLFMTRMHERYLFASLLLLLTAGAALKARPLWAVFGVLSLVQFFNVYFAYINFTEDNYLRVGWLFSWIEDQVSLFSLLAFLAFPILMVTSRFLAMREERAAESGKG